MVCLFIGSLFIEMLGFTVYSHVAPLGLGYLMYRVFYKHAAPLGLKTRFLAFPFSRFALSVSLRCIYYASRLSKICPIKHICQPLAPPMQKILVHSLGITRRDLRC